MKFRYAMLILAAATIAGCASTNLTSYTDPDYTGKTFTSVMIVADSPDLEYKLTMENRFVERFQDEGVQAIAHYRIFPPTREFTYEAEIEELRKRQVEAILVIMPGDAGWEATYVPPSVNVTTKTEKKDGKEKTKTEVSTSGGYNINKPWAQAQAKLYEVESGKCAWISSAFTAGSGLASMNTVDDSYAEEVVDNLIEQHVCAPPRR